MKLIVIATTGSETLSDELAFARSRMMALLPREALCVAVEATTFSALVGAAQRKAEVLGLKVGDAVLLLRHSFFHWTPGALARLAEGLAVGEVAVTGFDSTDCCPGYPPDYATIRGLERYAVNLRSLPAVRASFDRGFPAMLLCSVGGLRRNDWRDVLRLPDVYAHDFSGYHQGCRTDVLPLVPRSVKCVLDVGGGEGGFLEALKAELGCETHLAEFSPAACFRAKERVDRVWPGDFLAVQFDRQFDCISFLDVLEHTIQPELWLDKAKNLLAPDGTVVASIPNVGHWSVVADLLEGRWDYAAAGIHCITHVRFFTRRGVAHLFAEAGLEIVELHPTRIEAPAWFDCSSFSGNLAVDRDSLSTYAFLIVARRLA